MVHAGSFDVLTVDIIGFRALCTGINGATRSLRKLKAESLEKSRLKEADYLLWTQFRISCAVGHKM